MARTLKITKEMITDAAVEVIRNDGYEALNARSVAKELGCSTQPVLYQFQTMEELVLAAYAKADQIHTQAIVPKGKQENPLLELGMNYIRFACEEKNLFRFLFQSDHFSGKDLPGLTSDPETDELVQVVSQVFRCSAEQAQQKFQILFVAVHGYASLLANNAMTFEEAQCASMLEKVYEGVK